MTTHFVVCVYRRDRPAELLVDVSDLHKALHAIGVFLLFAPCASVALWTCAGGRPVRVLNVEEGCWRVVAPEGWVAAA